MAKKKSILKRFFGVFLLFIGLSCIVSFIGFLLLELKAGFPIFRRGSLQFSFNFLFLMAIFAFIGYQSIKHGYYLLKYGESKEKVTANRAITLDVTSLPDQENSPE